MISIQYLSNRKSVKLLLSTLLVSYIIVLWQPLHAAKDSWKDPHDFFSANQNKGFKELLRNVEKHHLPQAIEAYKQGKLGYAREDLDFVLRYFPNHPKALFYMGKLALRTKKPKAAEKYFKTAIKLFPFTSSTYAIYGIYLHKLKRFDIAVEKYKKALEIDPKNAEIHYNLGLTYVALKKYEQATIHAEMAYKSGFPLPGLQKMLKNHKTSSKK